MNNFRIREFDPNKLKRSDLFLQKINKGTLAIRLRVVEFQLSKLSELYKLNLNLSELSVTGEISPSDGKLIEMSNDLRLLLIDYLRWILHHLKLFHLKEIVKFEKDRQPLRTREFHIRLTNAQKFIQTFLASDPNIASSPNNRAGRFCEHVDTDNNTFNMGTVLMKAIRNYEDINSGQSYIFSRYEVETLIRSKKPNFISGVLINYFTEFFRVEECSLFINVTNAIYNSTTQLFYQVYNDPGYNQLKTLIFFLASAITRCDYILTEKIFYAIVKIWEILGIDQIEGRELLIGINGHESFQNSIIQQTWINIWPLFLQNSYLYPFAPGFFILSNFSFPMIFQLNNSQDLLIKLSRIPLDHRDALSMISNKMCCQIKYLIVKNYVGIALSIQDGLSPFELSAQFEEEYNINQILVNMFLKYSKHKFNTKFSLNVPIEMDNFLMKTLQPNHILNNSIPSIFLTTTVYSFQMQLIYPSVFTHPAPTGLNAKKLSLLLYTSLSFNFLMEKLIYACFQKKISSLKVKNPDEMLLLSKLADYLEENYEPNLDEEVKEKCFFILRCRQFGPFLIIIYSLLNILCSSNFIAMVSSNPTLPQSIIFSIQNIVRILSIVKLFKRPNERMDCEMVILSLKTNVPKFSIPKNLVIDWSAIF